MTINKMQLIKIIWQMLWLTKKIASVRIWNLQSQGQGGSSESRSSIIFLSKIFWTNEILSKHIFGRTFFGRSHLPHQNHRNSILINFHNYSELI